jgi:Undecaprenyl-phosphate glucose phosphotransferase
MIHRYSAFVKAINLTFDYVMLNTSLFIAWYMLNQHGLDAPNHYVVVALGFNALWFVASSVTGLYKHMLVKDSIITFRGLINTYLLFIGFVCFGIILSLGSETYFIGRPFLFYSLLIFGFLLTIWKLVFLAIRKTERAALMNTRTFIIVGGGRVARDLYKFFENNPQLGYKLKGYFHDDPAEEVNYSDIHVGPSLSSIAFAIENKIDEIFCTLPNSELSRIEALMSAADRNLIRFKFVPEYFDFERRPTYIENFGHIPVVSVRPEPLENMLNRFVKRLFDIIFSILIILLVCSWLFPVLAILIKIGSKGPVFFTQIRSGRDNRPFKCYKLRSMRLHTGAEDKQAERRDYRVTKLGAFMRRTSIDELPQFFNVLIGNMSVVGPRPHMISHTEQYRVLIDKFMVRHFLKPGITGYAQVNGLRGETKTTEAMLLRVEADVWYLENWSFLLDMKIIVLTIWNLAKGDKNAF